MLAKITKSVLLIVISMCKCFFVLFYSDDGLEATYRGLDHIIYLSLWLGLLGTCVNYLNWGYVSA